jgi:hypothetical protein
LDYFSKNRSPGILDREDVSADRLGDEPVDGPTEERPA